MATPSKLYVPRAEYEAEVAELRRLQTELASVQEKLSRIETETYNPLWRENVRLVRRIRYRETRLREYTTRLAELRRIGWARLHRLEREEYIGLREAIPRTRVRLAELREAQDKVIAELWRVIEELTPLRTETARLKTEIKTAQDKISRKVTVELKRVQLNAYVVIEEREKTYYKRRRSERTARKHGKYVKVTVRYPKGRFQSWFECDSWVIPDTETVLLEREPTYTLIKEYVIPHVNDELAEKFNILPFTPESFTFGETSTILSDEDLGKPPVKIKVERTVEDVKPEHTIKNPWEEIVSEEILTQEDYNRLVSDYPDYVEELKRLGKWRGEE